VAERSLLGAVLGGSMAEEETALRTRWLACAALLFTAATLVVLGRWCWVGM
jgi:hypothetical protein